MHKLFSYGTLQLEKVQLETYGRLLKGNNDVLFNHKIEQLRITDPIVLAKSNKEFHPILIKSFSSEDKVEGVIFEITDEELAQTDLYEVDDYERVFETFESGTKAWVYVKKAT
ncbi:gamma-glutamylcyclotransferase family protein [Galbibacter orientalis]|uniref:AIG2-like family protein n=1 Tax=Galbibacter orientalis DSM 19592 TaxID=926559 RepID=I3C120_9FLAO|nr:gamma-glutamylcyclotransferase family protein [Galbibacter orientalis]EIJ37313.1 AIG2-like family protein [Galbibacter orientalis DSM 19592]